MFGHVFVGNRIVRSVSSIELCATSARSAGRRGKAPVTSQFQPQLTDRYFIS
ncbi:unnamed protein product, partial [Heterotrigona itama]